jgi:dienelactone hydrolase
MVTMRRKVLSKLIIFLATVPGITGLIRSTQITAGYEMVVYHRGEFELKGFLCKPEGSGPFPAVIYNHGGLGHIIGGAPAETCEALASEGLVGFSPIRRQTLPLRGNLNDLLAGLNYAKALDYVDKERIGIIGFSRGGLLTFMAATQRADLKAIIIMAPAPGRGALELFLNQADQISAPVLLLVAENDHRRADHVQLSRMVKKALDSAGKKVTLTIYPAYQDDGHRLFFQLGDYWPEVIRFLQQHLGHGKR